MEAGSGVSTIVAVIEGWGADVTTVGFAVLGVIVIVTGLLMLRRAAK